MSPLLEIRDLSVQIATPARSVAAVSGVSLQIERGDIVGLVGESGAGKTMLARAITGAPPGRGRAPRARCCSTAGTCCERRARS